MQVVEKRGVIYTNSEGNVVRPIPINLQISWTPPILSGIFFFQNLGVFVLKRASPENSVGENLPFYEAVMASINFIKKNVYHYVKEI